MDKAYWDKKFESLLHYAMNANEETQTDTDNVLNGLSHYLSSKILHRGIRGHLPVLIELLTFSKTHTQTRFLIAVFFIVFVHTSRVFFL